MRFNGVSIFFWLGLVKAGIHWRLLEQFKEKVLFCLPVKEFNCSEKIATKKACATVDAGLSFIVLG